MLVRLKQDWSNWDIYADVTKAHLNSRGLGGHINPRTVHNPPPGPVDSPQRQAFVQYTTNEGIGVLILYESLPTSIYQQITGEDTLYKKWWKLKQLMYQHTSSAVKEGPDQVEQNVSTRALFVADEAEIQQAHIDGGDGAGDAQSISYTEEQSIIIDQLKRFPKCAAPGVTPLLTHLTMLKVLREALANRDMFIPDIEFLEYVAESFLPASQNRIYVKAVVERMKKEEVGVGGGKGDTQRPETAEVFEMLLEIEKQARVNSIEKA